MDEIRHQKAKIYYSMGEVAEMFDVNQSLIRFWESKFDILKPHKNKKGNRLFTPKDIENIKLIYHLVREKGMTLAGAQKLIKQNREGLQRDIEIIDRLMSIRAMLVEIREELRMGGSDFSDESYDYEPDEKPAQQTRESGELFSQNLDEEDSLYADARLEQNYDSDSDLLQNDINEQQDESLEDIFDEDFSGESEDGQNNGQSIDNTIDQITELHGIEANDADTYVDEAVTSLQDNLEESYRKPQEYQQAVSSGEHAESDAHDLTDEPEEQFPIEGFDEQESYDISTETSISADALLFDMDEPPTAETEDGNTEDNAYDGYTHESGAEVPEESNSQAMDEFSGDEEQFSHDPHGSSSDEVGFSQTMDEFSSDEELFSRSMQNEVSEQVPLFAHTVQSLFDLEPIAPPADSYDEDVLTAAEVAEALSELEAEQKAMPNIVEQTLF